MNLLPIATELYDQGFAVTPTQADKGAFLRGWTKMVGDNRLVPNGEFTDPRTKGCGVVLGQWHDNRGYLGFIDVDCYDKNISNEMCNFIMGRLGGSYPYRVGMKPKFGVPVLMSKPSGKLYTAHYDRSQIEFLGTGGQFVAYGDYPETEKGCYTWHGGELTSEVPMLAEDDLLAIFDKFDELCLAAGMTKKGQGKLEKIQALEESDPLDVAIANRPLDIDRRQIKQLLKGYKAKDLDHDAWFKVGMALYHEFEGSDAGLVMWDKWSKKDPERYDKRIMRKRWDSFGGHTRPVTMASIIKAANAVKVKEFSHQGGGYLYPKVGSSLAQGTYINWVVEDIIEAGTIGQIFASSGTGKTFFALDIAAHLAAGVEWNKRRVVGGPVVYLVGEGVAGIKRRLAAIEKEKNLDLSQLYMARMPNFGDSDELQALLLELKALPIPPVMIIIDTLARAIVGLDENQSKDMGPIVEAMATFTRKLGCVVMDIHHTPKGSGDQSRGSGAIKAAMDFEIRLEGDSRTGVKVSCAKSKDAEAFDEMAFKLATTKLPKNHTDNFNRRVTSAVIEWMEVDDVEKSKSLTGIQSDLMKAFDLTWADESIRVATPQAVITDQGLDVNSEGVTLEALKSIYAGVIAGENLDDNQFKNRWDGVLRKLREREVIYTYDGIIVKK